MKTALSRCAAAPQGDNTSGPAKPVPQCSWCKASLAVHGINLVEIFYAIF
jgi:hypothetical protein